MTLPIKDAENILQSRLGEPVKTSTIYVSGFVTETGQVLAIDRVASETRIWFQPPAPPSLDGVRLLEKISNANSNINGPLQPLRDPTTLRVEIDSDGALNRFLDWYAGAGSARKSLTTGARINPSAFRAGFARFQELIVAKSGRPFSSFSDGLIHDWESYKPRLRDHALGLLRAGDWPEAGLVSGTILNCVIEAIEIQDTRTSLTNNLVFWQNRFGHANRDHRRSTHR